MQWIEDNFRLLQLVLGGATLLVWVAYLQVFIDTLRRRRRPMILVTIGPGDDVDARCMISNLGMEPVYLLDVIVRVEAASGVEHAVITDRNPELSGEESRPSRATNQGPLETAATRDIGSFASLVRRAMGKDEDDTDALEDARRLELTAVVAIAADNRLGGAVRAFALNDGEDGGRRLTPETLYARQIRKRSERRRLEARLEERRPGNAPEG